MIDPLAATLLALTSRSPLALGLVFLAGVITSIGPCIAPRYIAIAAIVSGDRRPIVPTFAFVLGLMSAFVTLGFVAGLLGTLWSLSSAIYLTLAISLICGGGIALVRAVPDHTATPACTHHMRERRARRPLGAIYLLGAASAFIISPCCTPVVGTVVAVTTAIGKPLVGAVLLSSFAAGHALPLFFAPNVAAIVSRVAPQQLTTQAPAIVGAVLMMALGIYYGVLA